MLSDYECQEIGAVPLTGAWSVLPETGWLKTARSVTGIRDLVLVADLEVGRTVLGIKVRWPSKGTKYIVERLAWTDEQPPMSKIIQMCQNAREAVTNLRRTLANQQERETKDRVDQQAASIDYGKFLRKKVGDGPAVQRYLDGQMPVETDPEKQRQKDEAMRMVTLGRKGVLIDGLRGERGG